MKKPILYLLCGLPACGKSTYAKKLNGDRVSSDELRDILLGSEEYQWDGAYIFSMAYWAAELSLKSGRNVVFDTCNISEKVRKAMIVHFSSMADIIAVDFKTPVNVCKARNESRKRVVPDIVYSRMLEHYTHPSIKEGFTKIIVV